MGLDIGKNVEQFMQRKMAGFYELLNAEASALERAAKEGAPWNDRTGHARQTIHAGVDIESDGFHLYLAHGKEYGTMLEMGTGIYGPFKRRIKPINAKALIIPGLSNPKDPSKPLMVRSIKGMVSRPIIGPTVKSHKKAIIKRSKEYWGD